MNKTTTTVLTAVASVLLGPTAVADPETPRFPRSGEITRLVNVNSGKCLEVPDHSTADGARAQQWTCVGARSQNWVWYHLGTTHVEGPGSAELRHYWITNRHSGKCLEVADSSTANGAPVQQWTCDANAPGQVWTVALAWGYDDPYSRRGPVYNRRSYHDKALEIADSATHDGARAQVWTYDETNTMRWDW